MDHTPLPAGVLVAARTLIDATSTFSPTSTIAENHSALTRALIPLGEMPDIGARTGEVASGAVICMQWLVFRTSEALAIGREEVLWSLREFVGALQQGDPAAQPTAESPDPL